jgi:hypothetical protein
MTVILGLSQKSYDWTIYFNAEVRHYHGLGEQYFINQCTFTVSRCNASHDIILPLHQKFTLIAWTYNDYVLNVTDSLQFLPSTKGFSARLLYFSMSHTNSPIVGRVT